MSITRYEPYVLHGVIENCEDPDGTWVSYEDHAAEVQRLQRELDEARLPDAVRATPPNKRSGFL